MKFISWNVNGLRACREKGFLDFFKETDADIFCIQETKLQEGQIELDLPGYHQYWNYAQKKGYSGTAIFTKQEPLSVSYGIGIAQHDTEGRVITLEYPDFYFITCYTPNSQNELKRLSYRMQWEDDFLAYLKKLEETKENSSKTAVYIVLLSSPSKITSFESSKSLSHTVFSIYLVSSPS